MNYTLALYTRKEALKHSQAITDANRPDGFEQIMSEHASWEAKNDRLPQAIRNHWSSVAILWNDVALKPQFNYAAKMIAYHLSIILDETNDAIGRHQRKTAKRFYDRRQAGASLPTWDRKRRAFLHQCRRLAANIDRHAEAGTDASYAMMYLDAIALREGATFKFFEGV